MKWEIVDRNYNGEDEPFIEIQKSKETDILCVPLDMACRILWDIYTLSLEEFTKKYK